MPRIVSAFWNGLARVSHTPDAWAIALLLAGIATAQLAAIHPVTRIQETVFDLYQRAMPRERTSSPVIIVAVDENALATVGQWPWPRSVLAELIKRISADEPASIGLDMFFPEADRLSPPKLADAVPGLSDDLRSRLRALPSSDAEFADALRSSRAVLGLSGEYRMSPRAPPLPVSAIQAETPGTLPEFAGYLQSTPQVQDAAIAVGLINVGPIDQITRQVPVIARVNGQLVASLGVEALRSGIGAPLFLSSPEAGLRTMRIGSLSAPIQADGLRYLHYGHFDGKGYVSAIDVLSNRVPPGLMKDRVILVAVAGLGLLDFKSTPLGELVPGVEIHSQLIEQLYEGRALARPSYLLTSEVLALFAIGIGLAMLARFASLRAAMGAYFAAILAAFVTGVFAFRSGLLVDIGTPVLGWTVGFFAMLTLSLVMARRAREKAVYMFSRFVNPHVVKELLKDEAFAAGGQERRITLLFSDIRNFTALSERQTPAEIVAMLNAYFSRQVEIVFRHKGALDKFIGDAMMVFWGAPLDDPDHARNAVRCALEMTKEAERFRAELRDRMPGFEIGIGIHTGQAVVGLVGAEMRREYTAIGSVVNVASRVESLTKEAGRGVLVTRETMEACEGSEFLFESAGAFAVKGVDRKIEVFEPKVPGMESGKGNREVSARIS